MTLYCAPLPHRALLTVAGEDAEHFLQGLVSNDVRKVGDGKAIYAALLTPQGKFLHDMFISVHNTPTSGNEFWLECERARMEDLAQRLGRYKLRAKVTITPQPEYQVYAVWSDAATRDSLAPAIAEQEKVVYADPRHAALGWRVIGSEGFMPVGAEPAAWEDYETHRLQLGVADGSRDIIVDRMFLLEAGLDDLHGADFAKGCYVGQEVTARSKHRGGVRKFLFRVTADQPLPPAGTLLLSDGKEVGEMRSSLGRQGIALLRLEGWQAAKTGVKLLAGEVALTPHLPEWSQVTLD